MAARLFGPQLLPLNIPFSLQGNDLVLRTADTSSAPSGYIHHLRGHTQSQNSYWQAEIADPADHCMKETIELRPFPRNLSSVS